MAWRELDHCGLPKDTYPSEAAVLRWVAENPTFVDDLGITLSHTEIHHM